MKNDYRPIMVTGAVPTSEGMKLLLVENEFEILEPLASDIWKILSFCNGYNDLKQVIVKSKLSEAFVIAVISDLEYLGVVTDSREQFLHFNKMAQTPTPFGRFLKEDEILELESNSKQPLNRGECYKFSLPKKSSLIMLQKERHSVRNFKCTPLCMDQLGRLCNIGYDLKRHATPSGGNIYPLKLFVLVECDQIDFPKGVYEFNLTKNEFIRYTDIDLELVKFLFDSENFPFESSIQIVITANLDLHPKKYSNMGYKLTLLEVGHVAQNISLGAIEMGLGSCELGGAFTPQLKQVLNLDESMEPLLCIAVGYKETTGFKKSENKKILEKLEQTYLGTGKLIKDVSLHYFPESSFFGGTAELGNNDGYSGATSYSSVLAKIKSISEGVERIRSRTILQTTYYLTEKEVESRYHNKVLTPNEILPLTMEQIEKQNLLDYREDQKVLWVLGESLQGKKIFVPVDLVYYGQETTFDSQKRLYYFNLNKARYYKMRWANSSGVAAYSTYDQAVKNATFELLERDGLMRIWLNKKTAPKIPYDLLPFHIQRRIDFWKLKNHQVYFLLIPSSLVYIVQAIIVGPEYPAFVTGACAGISLDRCISKAFEEAEYALIGRIHFHDTPLPKEKITQPTEHGAYYADPKNLSKISWLWSGNYLHELPRISSSWEKISSSLDLIVIDLSGRAEPLKVVRVLSKRLVPISFGFGNDYFNHPLIKESNDFSATITSSQITLPHFYA